MLRRFICIAGIFCAALAGVLIYTISLMINRPLLAPPGKLSDADYTEFSSVTEDGIKIYAVYYRGFPACGTVILCHGHGVNLRHMDDVVRFLRPCGYNILLLDFRAHGQSGGKYCTVGLHEWKDIKAVLSEAKKLGYIDASTPLAAYGRSMGAATLLNGSADLPEIRAFILESGFESLRKIAARDAWHALRLPDTFLSDIAFWVTGLVTGIDYASNKPEEKTAGVGSRPVFLIHDSNDHRADANAFNALKTRLPLAETWVVKDGGHVGAHWKAPAEFESRFLSFLSRSGVSGRN